MSSDSFPVPQGGPAADARPGPSIQYFLTPAKPYEAAGVEVWMCHHVATDELAALRWLAEEVGDVERDPLVRRRGTVTPR